MPPRHSLRTAAALAGVTLVLAPASHADPPPHGERAAAARCPARRPRHDSVCPRSSSGRECRFDTPALIARCLCAPPGAARPGRWQCSSHPAVLEVMGPAPPPELPA